ncbi:MAG: D-2-hydroxyacid dehydrogenase [Gemmatimonadales bacterium]|nr:MAG: D-2-hydroxyacid dehydrogenase [Gemmatimonadales bacterium]
MSRVVLDLADRRPIWTVPDWAVDRVREALPAGWELIRIQAPADGSGDGGRGPVPEVLEAVRGARVYLGYGVPPEILEAGAGTLEWVHSGAAGVGSSLHDAMRRSSVLFTNSAGIHGPPMAETVLGMILHFMRGLDFALAAQGEGRWDQAPFLAADTPVTELAGSTVGILGYGGIGREVGRRVAALGARVLGLRRGGGEAAEPGVELLSGPAGLDRILAESHVVVVSVPDTPATRGMLTRERLRSLRPGAVLVNVSRGKVLDEDALVEVLREGRIRGAGLDVFRKEPLPADSPLWSLPNVLLTPHVSAVSRGFWRRETELMLENFSRFLEGRPLRNLVDREAGY